MSKSLYNTIIESSAPTTSTEGIVGNFYIDTSASPADLYLCTKIDTTTTPTTYEWTKQGGSNEIQQDTSATSVATLYNRLEVLRNSGHEILSISFNSNSNITLTRTTVSTSDLTTPVFTSSTSNQTIITTNPTSWKLNSYVRNTTANSTRYKFSGFDTTTMIPFEAYISGSTTLQIDIRLRYCGASDNGFSVSKADGYITPDSNITSYTIYYI